MRLWKPLIPLQRRLVFKSQELALLATALINKTMMDVQVARLMRKLQNIFSIQASFRLSIIVNFICPYIRWQTETRPCKTVGSTDQLLSNLYGWGYWGVFSTNVHKSVDSNHIVNVTEQSWDWEQSSFLRLQLHAEREREREREKKGFFKKQAKREPNKKLIQR